MKDLSNWDSFEALDETIRRDTSAVAQNLHQSPSLIRKWKEPPVTEEDFQQSGARNPLDRIAIIISTIEKIDRDRAYLPVLWLCAKFGFMPPIPLPDNNITDKDILKAILNWNKEFGETASRVAKVLEDGRVTEEEYKAVFKEAMEDIEALMSLLLQMKQRVR